MSALPAFDPLACPLTGINLVEANAGTGKTFCIARLYLRLVLEGGFNLDEIVAVTYTRAATAELRHRIHAVLLEASRVAEGFAPRDARETLIPELLGRLGDPRLSRERLRNALLRFDEVTIDTLHGFCASALSAFPVECGTQPHARFLDEVAQKDFREELFRDFCRTFLLDPPKPWIPFLGNFRYPGHQLDLVQPQMTHPRLTLLPEPGAGASALIKEIRADFKTMAERLKRERPLIEPFLTDCVAKRRTVFKEANRALFLNALEAALEERAPAFPEDYDALFPEAVAKCLLKGRRLPDELHFFKEFEAFIGRLCAAVARFKAEAVRHFREQGPLRKVREGVRTYDDLIVDLHEAVSRDGMLFALRGKYKAALIDEFQDTDPRQFEIFSRIFGGPGRVLYLIGDPKQSIYSFRGADIFNYRDTRETALAQSPLTLHRNYRSHSGLIRAVNRLFDPRTASGLSLPPFLTPHLAYPPSQPSGTTPQAIARTDAALALTCRGRDLSGMTLWLLAPAGPDGSPDAGRLEKLTRADAYARIADAVALEISGLLNGRAHIGKRPAGLGDFAVLTRSAYEASFIKKALEHRGVPYVHYGENSVIDSSEAGDLHLLLTALLSPDSLGRVRAALATPFCGFGLERLLTENDDAPLEEEVLFFSRCGSAWRDAGLMACARMLMARYRVVERFLSRFQGRRSLTNYLHLFELLDGRSRELRGEPERLIRWFLEERMGERAQGLPPDQIQLRLDRDTPAVRIMTLFRSKGLEFPVVFYPYPWTEFNTDRETALCYHDRDGQGKIRLIYDLTCSSAAKQNRSTEKTEENLRLIYVALTRASSACYFTWGRVKDAENSALGYLIHCRAASEAATARQTISDHIRNAPAGEFLEAIRDRVGPDPEDFRLAPLPIATGSESAALPQAPLSRLTFRRFARTLTNDWRTGSYSGLAQSRAQDEEARFLLEDGRDEGAGDLLRPDPEPPQGIFALPKGSRTGECLHTIFEKIDFPSFTPAASLDLIAESLSPLRPAPEMVGTVAAMVERVVDCPLTGDFGPLRLREVTARDRLSEIEFLFPVKGISPARLTEAFKKTGLPEWMHRFTDRLPGLRFAPFQGHLQGFADLIFRHGGRFYLLDWKSNHLGNSPADYAFGTLKAAMVEADYVLQYHLYTVALDRFLKNRLPDYRYDRHFGGVFYCFLRGVHPDFPESGVFYDRPNAEIIQSLSRAMENDNG